jgi:hypothetical protein
MSPRPVGDNSGRSHRYDGHIVGAILLGFCLFLLWPLGNPTTHLIGDPGSDAVRGMWGLDHIRRSLLPPDALLFSREFNFPFGGWALILPFVSSLLLSPIAALTGPVAGWNLCLLFLLWSAGMATALLARELSGSWGVGLAAGGALLGQPMLLASVADGTAEHLAYGGFSLALLALLRAARPGGGAAPAVIAAAAGALLALESPYLAVFLLVFALALTPRLLLGWWGQSPRARWRRLVGGALMALVALALLALLFGRFPQKADQITDIVQRRTANALSLSHWWRLETATNLHRDPTLPPTAIPIGGLVGSLGLALLNLRRSWPYLLATALFFSLSIGGIKSTGAVLAQWWGPAGQTIGDTATELGDFLYGLPGFSQIRFPRRTLVPAALAALLAAAAAWPRFRLPFRHTAHAGILIGALIGGLAFSRGLALSRFHDPFPRFDAPRLAFADWIRTKGPSGGVALIPGRRAARQFTERHKLPIFAELSDDLRSSELLYIQVMHGQPQTAWPELLTIGPKARTPRTGQLLQDWDDLTLPATVGREAPPSAVDAIQDDRRRVGIKLLLDWGLRYLVVDAALMAEPEREVLRRHLKGHIAEERHFDDGTGIWVLVLQP